MKPKYPWHDKPTWGSKELKENWINLFLLTKHIFKIAFTKQAWISLWRLIRYIFSVASTKESWIKLWRLFISVVAFTISIAIEGCNKLWHLVERTLKSAFKWAAILIAILFIMGMVSGLIDSLHLTKKDLILMLFIGWGFWITMTVLQNNNRELARKIDELEEKIEELESRTDDLEPSYHSDEEEDY